MICVRQGEVCLPRAALWTPFFLEQNYMFCEAILTLVIFIHLYALFTPQLNMPVLRSRKHILTHLVAKSSTGLAVLYMWKTWGALGVSFPHLHPTDTK